MHRMRASKPVEDWPGVWLAGFSSRTLYHSKHWLFYLARIKFAYESHADLWSQTSAGSGNAKAAHVNFLGDIFEPEAPLPSGDARFSPARHICPTVHVHRQQQHHYGWFKDIDYRFAGRHPALLVADPQLTFIWNKPLICFADNHCRNYFKWPSPQTLLAVLRTGQ